MLTNRIEISCDLLEPTTSETPMMLITCDLSCPDEPPVSQPHSKAAPSLNLGKCYFAVVRVVERPMRVCQTPSIEMKSASPFYIHRIIQKRHLCRNSIFQTKICVQHLPSLEVGPGLQYWWFSCIHLCHHQKPHAQSAQPN